MNVMHAALLWQGCLCTLSATLPHAAFCAQRARCNQCCCRMPSVPQALEAALAEQRQTVSQLRAAAAAAQGEHQATVGGLLAELADKSSQLVDAERRFSQLESLIGRIASRTGGVQAGGGVRQQQQQYQAPQMPQVQRPSSAQGLMFGGGAAAGRLSGQQQLSAGGALGVGGGPGLGFAAVKQQQQQWEQQQQGLLSSLRGSRDQQQQQQQGIGAGWGAADGSVFRSAGGYTGSPSGGGIGY